MTHESMRELWLARISDYKSSGLTRAAWCAANDIPVPRFAYWRKRIAQAAKAARTAEVDWLQVGGEQSPQSAILPVRVGAAVIDVAPGFDPIHLRAIVSALGGAKC